MDNVQSPQHYTQGYIEVIYAIHDVLGREGFKAFCMGNYIKYNARANHKGLKSEDLAKADQYLEWATNGLPEPVNGRVPRPEPDDPFAQFINRGPDLGAPVTVSVLDAAAEATPTDAAESPDGPMTFACFKSEVIKMVLSSVDAILHDLIEIRIFRDYVSPNKYIAEVRSKLNHVHSCKVEYVGSLGHMACVRVSRELIRSLKNSFLFITH